MCLWQTRIKEPALVVTEDKMKEYKKIPPGMGLFSEVFKSEIKTISYFINQQETGLYLIPVTEIVYSFTILSSMTQLEVSLCSWKWIIFLCIFLRYSMRCCIPYFFAIWRWHSTKLTCNTSGGFMISRGGEPSPKGSANLLFDHIFPKTENEEILA